VTDLPRQTRLRNGITLLTKPSVHNDIVAIRAAFASGARNDPPGETGVSSLTCALMLKDTERRSAAETAAYLESAGGSIGEEVRRDLVALSVACTSDGLPVAVEVLSDALRRPAFLPHRIELERHNLLMAIREEEDSPLTATFKLFQKEIYRSHPYARPTRGEPGTVVGLGRDQVLSTHHRHVRPERLVLTCVGNFREDEAVSAWEAALGDWGVPGVPGEGAAQAAPAFPAEARSVSRLRAGEGVWAVLGYLAPPIGHADHVPMKVLDCVMGSSVDSRLFAEVRDRRGLAYVVGTTYPERREWSLFAAYWGTSPERQEATLAAVGQELARIREEAPTEAEVERAKEFLRGVFVMGQETNAGQASLFSFFETMGLGYAYAARYPEKLRAVTAADLRRVAERYLGAYTLAVTTPG